MIVEACSFNVHSLDCVLNLLVHSNLRMGQDVKEQLDALSTRGGNVMFRWSTVMHMQIELIVAFTRVLRIYSQI